ncbi:excinuclease ABC subunit UvrA [Paenibacillus allorhizosphaerae]|uniref:UvrABC system protein A n=1 Tax=Paenibacillus allorhizosphaerae TaxID=2849866 RepID=A0ABN7TXJ1_9BACL|nr:excinuclease ABC subunit UvrA [Paenibacillus allorhizosphaerae]CAG7655832.1 UvrABC system protein A [Paenibacillus allorhizosphaerae]
MKHYIEVRGARQNNLRNIDVNIPRDKLTVITGVSGSGKSSLAFEVIYGEGQRRFLESLSTFAKSRMNQLKKPDVDFVFGLSPVIAIEQKKGIVNPRSTVGTMTDLYDFMRLLFASAGDACCPFCSHPIPTKTVNQMIDRLQSLPEGTEIEVLAPVFKLYGEEYETLFDEIRAKGFRTIKLDGQVHSLSDNLELEEEADYEIEVVVDKIVVKPGLSKMMLKTIENSLSLVGDGFIRFVIGGDADGTVAQSFYRGFGCPAHQITMGELQANYFSFNDPNSACRTCGGLGTFMRTEPRFLVKNPEKSITKGALDTMLLSSNSTWTHRKIMFHSMSLHFGFSLDTPFRELPENVRNMLIFGTKGQKFPIVHPEEATNVRSRFNGRLVGYGGMVNDVNRWYKNFVKKKVSGGAQEEFFKRVMVEHACPDCEGKKLKQQRFCVTVGGKDIHELCTMPLQELRGFLKEVSFSEAKEQVGRQIVHEIASRLTLLIDIGLEYLSLGRRSDTISGGEAQRIRLSTQISSGLMGMLYVLDEPSIGLHARDSVRIVDTLKKLRDTGNTIIVVEHDIDTIKNADHIIEIGPGPGVRGGQLIAQGTAQELRDNMNSLTGSFMAGYRRIDLPLRRRQSNGSALVIKGARANNLRNVDVAIPLGIMVCVTGVSGSGKSTLINEVMYKQLCAVFQDARVVPGEHDALEGHESISSIINIDQSPIGRSSRSNPATYVGFFDRIRELFAESPAAAEKGLGKNDFSFNHKNGGRCEHCQGEGIVTTQLQFMPDIEAVCPACKGARFNSDVLEVQIKGKTIADVLEMSIEEAIVFFEDQSYILHKLNVLNQLGLGYLRLGQSSTTLSGGEAQRIKLATELGKIKRGAHNLYILDEPTTGLHLQDIQKLIDCINQLVEAGHTVLVIEHHLDIIKVADHIIDMGPEGGKGGGTVVAQGTPEEVAKVDGSYTGRFLRDVLESDNRYW